MVAPGFRSRIATGLLVAAVVLPVPIGATSAAAADRRVTPVDRPPHFVHPGDQPEDDFVQEVAGAEDYGLDGYSDDDFAADRRPVDGRGGEAGRRRHGHGHPGAPARFPELPPRFPGMSDAFSGFPHRSPHHHFAGPRGSGRWHHRPHHPFSPAFVGPDGPSYPLPGPDYGGADFPQRGHHGPPGGAGSTDADRAYPLPGRHAPAPKHPKPSASASPATEGSPARSSSSRRLNVADRLNERPYEALPPLPTPAAPKKETRSAPDSTDGDEAATTSPYAMESPGEPVERVLPMGAGLALTGLGLAFFALRMRRS
ncbi:hypothetical protein Scani_74170 [Streptomyces caniferus]|uniref:Gram-positive cocci surface proteins LPxTG domain-containing protein n=1 Tax=Streptomyces caniferus TaxID=285557 RepID=A0A640SI99_9ACTN|nr:hypothetical protein [Streptomyces caniferus]GFE11149.1 hypothetical protein Scani_74170 [Streptomyces caniferus]